MLVTGLERFEKSLLARAAELSQAVRRRKVLAIEPAAEACERLVLAAQREMAGAGLSRDSRLLRETVAALERIEDGGYGTCESCEDEIGVKRMEAVPWARYCIHCQERVDGGSKPPAGVAGVWRMAA